jgi:uncharacterized protein YeaO (DUF488 family)
MDSVRLGLPTIFLLLLLALSSRAREDPASYRTYIVFLSRPAGANTMSRSAHREWLKQILPTTVARRPFCSYTAIFHGFAARLTEAELAEVAKLPGFLQALPDSTNELALI